MCERILCVDSKVQVLRVLYEVGERSIRVCRDVFDLDLVLEIKATRRCHREQLSAE